VFVWKLIHEERERERERESNFVEESKNLAIIDTDLKIMLDHQNNIL